MLLSEETLILLWLHTHVSAQCWHSIMRKRVYMVKRRTTIATINDVMHVIIRDLYEVQLLARSTSQDLVQPQLMS